MAKHPGWQCFLKLCQSLKNEKELMQFFELFLTDEEKENLAARALIVQALLEGTQTQRDIAKNLHVSIAKITRGSNMIKRMDTQFLKTLFR